jgi:hypothetical protein
MSQIERVHREIAVRPVKYVFRYDSIPRIRFGAIGLYYQMVWRHIFVRSLSPINRCLLSYKLTQSN